MILDTSALLAVLLDEADADHFERMIGVAGSLPDVGGELPRSDNGH